MTRRIAPRPRVAGTPSPAAPPSSSSSSSRSPAPAATWEAGAPSSLPPASTPRAPSSAPWTSRLPRARAVEVVAHRGTARAPENTLASFRAALNDGATKLECDVQLSKDGVPVLMHDATLLRTTGRPGVVADYTAAELGGFDAGAWQGDDWMGEPIPTLASVLAMIDGRAQLAIELKTDGMERAVVDVVHAAGVAPTAVAVYAWDLAPLRAIAALDDRLPRTLLVDAVPTSAAAQTALARAAAAAGVQALGVRNAPHVDGRFCARAHAAGVEVYVWTVNDPAELSRLARAGVDGVVSDDPAAARRALDG